MKETPLLCLINGGYDLITDEFYMEKTYHFKVKTYHQAKIRNFSRSSILAAKHALFRNKKFILDEMTRRNASKFAIFYIYENPKFLFPFFISCMDLFYPYECSGLCQQLISPHIPNF